MGEGPNVDRLVNRKRRLAVQLPLHHNGPGNNYCWRHTDPPVHLPCWFIHSVSGIVHQTFWNLLLCQLLCSALRVQPFAQITMCSKLFFPHKQSAHFLEYKIRCWVSNWHTEILLKKSAGDTIRKNYGGKWIKKLKKPIAIKFPTVFMTWAVWTNEVEPTNCQLIAAAFLCSCSRTDVPVMIGWFHPAVA